MIKMKCYRLIYIIKRKGAQAHIDSFTKRKGKGRRGGVSNREFAL